MVYEPIFPTELQSIALTLLPTLSVGEQWPAQQGFIVYVQSQTLSAPSRVYYSPTLLRSKISCLKGEYRVLALCLGSRHWDGFIREECIRELIDIDLPWVVPFVVQLLGEYVIQIINVIVAALPHVNKATYGEFVRTNPRFVATTKRRATSYWDCYYRYQFASLRDYPALLAVEELMGMA